MSGLRRGGVAGLGDHPETLAERRGLVAALDLGTRELGIANRG